MVNRWISRIICSGLMAGTMVVLAESDAVDVKVSPSLNVLYQNAISQGQSPESISVAYVQAMIAQRKLMLADAHQRFVASQVHSAQTHWFHHADQEQNDDLDGTTDLTNADDFAAKQEWQSYMSNLNNLLNQSYDRVRPMQNDEAIARLDPDLMQQRNLMQRDAELLQNDIKMSAATDETISQEQELYNQQVRYWNALGNYLVSEIQAHRTRKLLSELNPQIAPPPEVMPAAATLVPPANTKPLTAKLEPNAESNFAFVETHHTPSYSRHTKIKPIARLTTPKTISVPIYQKLEEVNVKKPSVIKVAVKHKVHVEQPKLIVRQVIAPVTNRPVLEVAEAHVITHIPTVVQPVVVPVQVAPAVQAASIVSAAPAVKPAPVKIVEQHVWKKAFVAHVDRVLNNIGALAYKIALSAKNARISLTNTVLNDAQKTSTVLVNQTEKFTTNTKNLAQVTTRDLKTGATNLVQEQLQLENHAANTVRSTAVDVYNGLSNVAQRGEVAAENAGSDLKIGAIALTEHQEQLANNAVNTVRSASADMYYGLSNAAHHGEAAAQDAGGDLKTGVVALTEQQKQLANNAVNVVYSASADFYSSLANVAQRGEAVVKNADGELKTGSVALAEQKNQLANNAVNVVHSEATDFYASIVGLAQQEKNFAANKTEITNVNLKSEMAALVEYQKQLAINTENLARATAANLRADAVLFAQRGKELAQKIDQSAKKIAAKTQTFELAPLRYFPAFEVVQEKSPQPTLVMTAAANSTASANLTQNQQQITLADQVAETMQIAQETIHVAPRQLHASHLLAYNSKKKLRTHHVAHRAHVKKIVAQRAASPVKKPVIQASGPSFLILPAPQTVAINLPQPNSTAFEYVS